MTASNPTLHGTFRVKCSDPTCCGCVTLTWIPDEQAYRATCNECGDFLGWAKDDWNSNPDDRVRLGRDANDRGNHA